MTGKLEQACPSRPTQLPDGTTTRLRLIAAAERLVADCGPEGVSSRQISAAAHQTNNYAVQYHFGSKEGLLDAVFAHRLQRIDTMRSDLLADASAESDSLSVRKLLDVLMLPLAYEVQDPDSRYVSFVTRVFLYQSTDVPRWFGGGRLPVSDMAIRIDQMIKDKISFVPETLRNRRVHNVFSNCILALANAEYQLSGEEHEGSSTDCDLPFSAFVIDLLDTAAHALTAPVSDAAAKALLKVRI